MSNVSAPYFEQSFLDQALSIATVSTVRTSPNPRVGAVIVKDGVIVGVGVTRPPGEAHAEVVAIEAAGANTVGADMYVTLEPCCHIGKTGPCTEAIIKAGIARVFVGSIDPNPLVCGQGIAHLTENGVETTLVADDACEAHLDPFRKFIQKKMPWVHLKVASTLDGQLATQTGASKWITGPAARRASHQIRAQSDGVMVGIGTALADDPQLNVRDVDGTSPTAIILDSSLKIPESSRCLTEGTMIFHGAVYDEAKAKRLITNLGVRTFQVQEHGGRLDLNEVLSVLGQQNMIKIMVEGGGELLSQFLASRLADELSVFFAPKLFGKGKMWSSLTLTSTVDEAVRLERVVVETLGDDLHVRGRLSGGV